MKKTKSLTDKIVHAHNWLAGKLVIRDIPERLHKDIFDQQIASERIIGWAQLSIVLAFWFLYTLSPKAFPESVSFTPVPWFLSAYLGFTILRLYLTYQNKLNFSFLVFSIVVDMALLFGLIWSFHIQYDQPATFYLKAPTLMYVFIFIALRALRFEPGFVVFAGLFAAFGWLMMSYYAIASTGMESVTRNYVEYLTSNTILIGAEWDKVISILVVTAILAAVISRGQDLLKSAIKNDAVAQDLSKFVPDVIAKQIKENSHSPNLENTETDNCTILFIDLEAFTSISEEMTPVELVATLNAYFAVAAKSIHQYGGVINQFQGDAILASFNIPQKNAEHATNAIRAGLDILEMMKAKKFSGHSLAVRIGINTGNVTGGLVGIPERVHYTVHGDNVNIASRLEQMNKQYCTRILVSESTKNEAEGDFQFSIKGEESLRGRSGTTRIYTILDVATALPVS
jgi:adenylate cyclase